MIDQTSLPSILENALDAVIAMNVGGYITQWNTQAEAIFGWKKEEVLGRRLSSTIIPLKYRALHEAGLKKFQVSGSGSVINNRLELDGLRKNGSEFPVELTVTHIKQNNESQFYAFLRDITERKNYQNTLEGSKENLERALKMRDEFISITSHELKNPLTVLSIQTQIFKRNITRDIEKAYSAKKVDQLVGYVDEQVAKLLRLVDDMLDISRIRTGKLSMQWEEFNLVELIKSLLEEMKEQFTQSSTPPIFKTSHEVITGRWDKIRIEQIVTNLLTNAIRYGGDSPIEVHLNAFDHGVKLAVIDQGIGIPINKLEKIFDPFERAVDPSEIKGLGLGLYITKQLVLAHKGKIWAESQVGRGSSFYVELPLYSIPRGLASNASQ